MWNPFARKAAASDIADTTALVPIREALTVETHQVPTVHLEDPRQAAFDEFLAMADAGGFMNLVTGIGTERDPAYHSFYGEGNSDNWRMIVDNMVRTSALARRIVHMLPEDMTRAGWSRTWEDYDKDPKADTALTDVENFLSLDRKVIQGLGWGRQYGGAGCIIFVDGQNRDIDKPLVLDSIKKGVRLGLQPFDRWDLNQVGGNLERDPFSPFYGEPTNYTLTNAEQTVPSIHRSRIVLFHGTELSRRSWRENGYWHDSVMVAAMKAVKNYDGTTAGLASLMMQSNVDVLTIPGLAELLATDQGIAKVRKRFQASMMMKSINRVLLLDGGKEGLAGSKGEEFHNRQISFAGVGEAVQSFMADVAAAADVPVTRLFGQSPGGLNSTGDGDERNYYDHVAARQKRDLLPQLRYLYEVICRSVFGKMPPGFAIEFNPLRQLSDLDQSKKENLDSATDKAYLDMGVIKRGTIAKELKQRGTYTQFTDDDVADAEQADENADALSEAAASNAIAEAEAAAKAAKSGGAGGTGAGEGAAGGGAGAGAAAEGA